MEKLVVGPKSQRKKMCSFRSSLSMKHSRQVRNLEIILHSELGFDDHVNHVTRTVFYHFKNILKERKYYPELSLRNCSMLSFQPESFQVHKIIVTCSLFTTRSHLSGHWVQIFLESDWSVLRMLSVTVVLFFATSCHWPETIYIFASKPFCSHRPTLNHFACMVLVSFFCSHCT